MNVSKLWQATSPYYDKLFPTKIRFVVNERVKTQVVNSVSEKVIREVPMDDKTSLLDRLYV